MGLAFAAPHATAGAYDAQFRKFLEREIVPAARAAGVSSGTLSRELSGLTPDTSLPGLTRPGGGGPPKVNYQAEFRAPARYFSDNRFTALVRSGRSLMARHKGTLDAVERRFGVPRRIVLAIWARESGYGSASIPKDALRVVATRAFMGQRPDFFKKETVAALKILDDGHISRREMRSSWGGALGQPQFLPTSFLKYAVDFDGDGKRDIWRSAPDVLASIANYLKDHGWVPGRDWGYEVTVPADISCSREGPDRGQPIAKWVREGIKRVKGRDFPAFELKLPGYLLMPAGRFGPAFIATDNFYVLKEYNESDVYALFVGHLADRYGNDVGFVGNWHPIRTTTRGKVRQLQLSMEKAGHDVGGADGLIGFKTRRSLGIVQQQRGKAPTCWLD
ncbi:lytic murein transglycosylase [Rhodobium gokarnense]